MTTSTVTARRKGDPQHYVEGKNCLCMRIWVCADASTCTLAGAALLARVCVCGCVDGWAGGWLAVSVDIRAGVYLGHCKNYGWNKRVSKIV